jgi:hypothetical protein
MEGRAFDENDLLSRASICKEAGVSNPRWDTGGTPLRITAVEAVCASKVGRPLSHKTLENPYKLETPERLDSADFSLHSLG